MPLASKATGEPRFQMNGLDFDVAIVGSGPAGLSAALVLSRSCRRVVVCDDGKPRNRAALTVNGFLGLGACSPAQLRSIGREQCAEYGVTFTAKLWKREVRGHTTRVLS